MQAVSSTPGTNQKLSPTQYAAQNDPAPLRHPQLDDASRIIIIFAVIIPVVITFLLCIIAVCIYRIKKRRAENKKNIAATSVDQYNAAISEELPPSYIVVSETKPSPLPLTMPSSDTSPPPSYVGFVNSTN